MKEIILKFKSEEDYNIFLEAFKEQNAMFKDADYEETDDKITLTFEDSEIIRKRLEEEMNQSSQV